MGMPADASSRTACAVTCTLPKSETCEVSIIFTFCKTVCRDLTVSSSPLLPSVAPCSLTYSGRASSLAGIRRRTAGAGSGEPGAGSGELGAGSRSGSSSLTSPTPCSPPCNLWVDPSFPCSPLPAPCLNCSKWVSSGRQMPTREQRGHFGLSTNGGGMTPRAAVARSSWSNSRVRSTSGSSKGMETRLREST